MRHYLEWENVDHNDFAAVCCHIYITTYSRTIKELTMLVFPRKLDAMELLKEAMAQELNEIYWETNNNE